MSDDTNTTEAPTRREYVKYGGVVMGGGLLAGCAGQSDSESTPESTSTETATSVATDSETETETTATDDGSYTVEMFPVGEVEFEEVPETWMATYREGWGDMAVALGQADGNRTKTLGRFQMWYDQVGVDVDTDWPDFWKNEQFAKEPLYELDSDVHLWDPVDLMRNDNWDESDIEEIENNLGPFFGCYNRRVNNKWQLDMGYPEKAPTMLEGFEKLGDVFQEPERAEAFMELHEEVQTGVQSKLEGTDPAQIGLINSGSDPEKGKFWPLDPSRGGYEMKHFRDLNVEDAFASINTEAYGDTVDYESLLAVDPDIIVVHWGIHNDWENNAWDPEKFRADWFETMADHSVGQELTAVQNENIIPGAFPEQGPIISLFSIELTAQTLYPDRFGAFDAEQYPEIPEENQLFDRQRVRHIINGDI
jgi:iron complex transport system substrate-binding protein